MSWAQNHCQKQATGKAINVDDKCSCRSKLYALCVYLYVHEGYIKRDTFIAGPPGTRYAMVSVVGPSVCRPFHGHISKIKQDRPIIATKHYWEVGIADSVVAFRSSPWQIFWFQIMCKHEYGLLFDFCVRPQLLSTEQTVVPVLSTVVNGVRQSGPVVHGRRPLCLCQQLKGRTGGGPASFRSVVFVLRMM